MGAGSIVFARGVLADCMHCEALKDAEIALYDIDGDRLRISQIVLDGINQNCNQGRAKITGYLGVEQRKNALRGATAVINAIQVGGYEPSTVIDFEVPKKYGLRQTIGDTLGIGGIFRGLRTIPVMFDFASYMAEVCPDAWFLNYTNPMAILTGAMLKGTDIKTVGLCHSVQVVEKNLMTAAGVMTSEEFDEKKPKLKSLVAGINHMAWLLEISEDGKDLYPMLKEKAFARLAAARKATSKEDKFGDMVRVELMRHFGYYITESSEHNAEYHPYFMKASYPHFIEEFNIPLDEYPRRCINNNATWKEESEKLMNNPQTEQVHKLTMEYGAGIINAIVTDVPYKINGNVLNTGLIPNLPQEAIVEVPCLVDSNGVQGVYVGNLPPQLAALNQTNINPQLLTIEAALTGKKDYIYQAAMLDPHTASELSLDDIVALCDDLIEAHGDMLPKYK